MVVMSACCTAIRIECYILWFSVLQKFLTFGWTLLFRYIQMFKQLIIYCIKKCGHVTKL